MTDRGEAFKLPGRSHICGLGFVLLLALSGCGTTHRFVDEPKLSIDEPTKNVRDAAAELFHQRQRIPSLCVRLIKPRGNARRRTKASPQPESAASSCLSPCVSPR
jgi:hypothetical protein